MKATYALQWYIAGEWKTIDNGLSWQDVNTEWENIEHHTSDSVRLRVIRESDGFIMMGDGTLPTGGYFHFAERN